MWLFNVLVICSVLIECTLSISTQVVPQFADHPAISRLDLKFCGAFSYSQTSRGPLGCGYPAVGDHPWLVALGYRDQDGVLSYQCSGVLLTPLTVLTSATCAISDEYSELSTVRLGEYNLKTRIDCLWAAREECQEAKVSSVASSRIHPHFQTNSKHLTDPYNVAVVRLSTAVKIDSQVQTICLPLFASRSPPLSQFALSFGLNKEHGVDYDSEEECCECSRSRRNTSNIMDEERLVDYNSLVNTSIACHYELVTTVPANTPTCLGAGTPCIADLGSPFVSVDRYGGSYYVMGLTSSLPTIGQCTRGGVAVTYAPVEGNLQFILDSIDILSAEEW